MAAAPFLKFTLLNLKLRKEALYQGSFVVSQQLDDAHLGVNELAANLAAGDDSVPRKIISHAAQLPNSDTYWREQKRELDALHVFRRAEDGDLPTDFKSLSMAELWWPELEAVLADFVERTRGAAAAAKVRGPAETNAEFDPAFKRRMLLESGHVVAAYFDARTCNYFSTVGRELYEIDDVWWRYEFAKSRGAVHAHALLSSLRQHLRRKAALRRGYEAAAGQQDFAGLSQEARVREQQAQELEEVLQGDVAESLGLASMHPAGALPLQGLPGPQPLRHITPPAHHITPRHTPSRHVTPRHATSRHVTPRHATLRPSSGGEWVEGANGGRRAWEPRKADWLKPEGAREPWPATLLRGNLRSSAGRVGGIARFHRALADRVMLHECSGYCLREFTRIEREAGRRIKRYLWRCRFGYGVGTKPTGR